MKGVYRILKIESWEFFQSSLTIYFCHRGYFEKQEFWMQPSGKLITFKGRVFEDHFSSCAENDVPLIIEKNQLDAKDEIIKISCAF